MPEPLPLNQHILIAYFGNDHPKALGVFGFGHKCREFGMVQDFVGGVVFVLLRCLDAVFAHPVDHRYMTNPQQALYFAVTYPLHVQLQRLDHIVLVYLLAGLQHCKMVAACPAFVALPLVEYARFGEFFAVAARRALEFVGHAMLF